jgi:toxin HigB-1
VVIVSFGDKATDDFFHGTASKEARSIPSTIANVATRKLDMVNAAKELTDLRVPPGNRLEALSGRLAGRHSIRINDPFRIVFRWDGGAYEVRITDYH